MKGIMSRQNEPKMLQYQYCARYYYNLAEKINSIIWIASILVSCVSLFPNIEDSIWAKAILVVIELTIVIAIAYNNSLVKKASDIRAFFDDYVLNINSLNLNDLKESSLNEIVYKIINMHPEESKVQMNNSGNDTPAGVRDWYEFPDDFSNANPQLFCQKQNLWWTKRMIIAKSILFVIEALLIILFILLMLKLSKVPTAEKILCMIGFVIKSIERIAANVRYLWYYVKIEGAVEILDESCDERNIVSLQNKINKFRALPVLGNNRLHKKLANWLSTCFKKTAV